MLDVDVPAVLELGRYLLDGQHHCPDAPEPGGVDHQWVGDRGRWLEHRQLTTQDVSNVRWIGSHLGPTLELDGGVIGRGDAKGGVFLADRLPARRDEGPVAGHGQQRPGIGVERIEDRIRLGEVDEDLGVVQHELGGCDNRVVTDTGGDEMPEGLGLDEGTPLFLAEGSIRWSDIQGPDPTFAGQRPIAPPAAPVPVEGARSPPAAVAEDVPNVDLDRKVAIPPVIPDPVSQDAHMNFDQRRSRFRTLHESGTFLIPNPHDVGSCRLLASLGFPALATTSGGFAASLGRMDMTVSRVELVDHVSALVASTDLPISVDAERCFPESPGGVVATVELLAEAGAAGCSVEDWDPAAGRIEDMGVAGERVRAASAEADRHGMVLTARAENHLRGVDDVDDTVRRLRAYRDAGAHAVYAPGLTDLRSIARIVDETAAPVNVLLMPGGPSRDELESIGVRRLSVGSSLARIAYDALVQAAEDLLGSGSLQEAWPYLDRDRAQAAFARAKP